MNEWTIVTTNSVLFWSVPVTALCIVIIWLVFQTLGYGKQEIELVGGRRIHIYILMGRSTVGIPACNKKQKNKNSKYITCGRWVERLRWRLNLRSLRSERNVFYLGPFCLDHPRSLIMRWPLEALLLFLSLFLYYAGFFRGPPYSARWSFQLIRIKVMQHWREKHGLQTWYSFIDIRVEVSTSDQVFILSYFLNQWRHWTSPSPWVFVRNMSASYATVEKYKDLYGRKTVYFRD